LKFYLDSNVFIYAILDRGEKGEAAGKILDAMENEKFSGATSQITFEEIVFVVWKEKGKDNAIEAGKSFLELNNLEIISVERRTDFLGLEVMKETGLKPRDALHLASMELADLTEMVTEDSDFQKIGEIKKYTLKEFLRKISK